MSDWTPKKKENVCNTTAQVWDWLRAGKVLVPYNIPFKNSYMLI